MKTLAAAALTVAPGLAQTIVVTNGRIVTNTDAGIIEDGAVLIRDGDIVAVGSTGEFEADELTVIDAEGGWITPGLFHPHTQLGLIEVALESSTRDASANDSVFGAPIDIADGFNYAGNHIDEARIDGITRFALFPSTGQEAARNRPPGPICARRWTMRAPIRDAISRIRTGSFSIAPMRAPSNRPCAGKCQSSSWSRARQISAA